MKPYTLACVQMAPEKTKAESLVKAAAMIDDAAARGGEVVCLPELFATPYFCQVEDHAFFELAEPIPGPTTQAMAEAARKAKATVAVSLFERRAPGIYHNSLVVIDAEGEILDVYRKMHIPDDPGFYEKFYFTPGDLGFKSVDTAHGPVGTLVCWDQWFPEAARLTALSGAQLLLYPTAIGWHPSEKKEHGEEQREAWTTIQRSHAIANGVYVAAVNRVGHEVPESGGDGIEFWGGSFIAGPLGTILAQASQDREEIILATIDPAVIEEKRQGWPFLRDRRLDAYQPIVQRFLK